MTWENEFPLPDYDGGPRDRMREDARRKTARLASEKEEEIRNIRQLLAVFVSDLGEVERAAQYLYDSGYRRR